VSTATRMAPIFGMARRLAVQHPRWSSALVLCSGLAAVAALGWQRRTHPDSPLLQQCIARSLPAVCSYLIRAECSRSGGMASVHSMSNTPNSTESARSPAPSARTAHDRQGADEGLSFSALVFRSAIVESFSSALIIDGMLFIRVTRHGVGSDHASGHQAVSHRRRHQWQVQ
jgi:hypothetical protein